VLVLDSDAPWIPAVSKPSPGARIFHIDVDPLKQDIPLWYFKARKVLRADGAPAIGQAVDHDGPARRDAETGCPLAIFGVGIGDVQSLVVMALSVARIDDVMALRRAPVALAFLGREAALAQRHLVGADHFAPGQQFHPIFGID